MAPSAISAGSLIWMPPFVQVISDVWHVEVELRSYIRSLILEKAGTVRQGLGKPHPIQMDNLISAGVTAVFRMNRIFLCHFLVPIRLYDGLLESPRRLICFAPVTIGNQLFSHSCHSSVVRLMESLQTLVVIQS